ncbi:MAG: hypothetical protein KDC24_01900 [Saprospiraceae bacterium]|nr:hypothetical protein [Saprospiraceae bacterium]
MMKKNKLFLLLLFLSLSFGAKSQQVDWGHGITMSVSFPQKFRFIVSYNVNAQTSWRFSDGVGFNPILDAKVSIFKNHLGSSVTRTFAKWLNANIALSYGGVFSGKERHSESFLPIFTTTYANALNNRYKWNFGFSTSYIFHLGLVDKHVPTQKLGNLLVSAGDLYLVYYNDGGPVLKFFGDGEDRYWTGGIGIGYTHWDNGNRHQFEIAFDKFTGFEKHAFEATGLLFIDNVIYKDLEQISYTTGRTSFKYLNYQYGVGVSANIWNLPFDLQDLLHRDVSNNPYHHKIENQYIDAEFYKFFNL